MKKNVILAVMILSTSLISFSQETDSSDQEPKKKEHNTREFQTLLGHNNQRGAYGAFTLGYSSIDSKQAILFGGRFEWLANSSIGVGFGGTGFINEYHYEPVIDRDVFLTGGYGGLYIEPIILPRFPVHLSFPVLLGAGGVSYITRDSEFNDNFIEDSEAFLIVEPGAELELNLTRHIRLALGASYRFTTPFDIGTGGDPLAGSDSLEGISYMVTFKFGRF